VGPLLTAKCGNCHGELATAGLNILTYEALMEGSKDGPVIILNDSENSPLVEVQSTGKHFANLTAEELAVIQQWIDAGAPEK
jgi:hypothetical protein